MRKKNSKFPLLLVVFLIFGVITNLTRENKEIISSITFNNKDLLCCAISSQENWNSTWGGTENDYGSAV